MTAWAAHAPLDVVSRIANLRLSPKLRVAVTGDQVWLRGDELSGDLHRRLRLVPALRLFNVLPDRQLVPHGARVPQGYLPEAEWQALDEWLDLNRPAATWPATKVAKVRLRVVRSAAEAEANLLLVPLAEWAAYAERAPQVRLQRWSFACDAGGRVLVRGTPLPPLPGERWVELDGVAVAAGHAWSPRLPAAVIRTALELAAGDYALLHSDGSFERVPGDALVRATRSAVRLTVQGGRPDA